MHLVVVGDQKILLDCGLHRGEREEAFQRNRCFPFDPAALDAVVLSHAHIDHCGNLPNLVRQGFQGPIYCTPPTRDLVAVMLNDSARIQEEDAFVDTVIQRAGSPGRNILYSRSDARQAIQQCHGVPYQQPQAISPTVQLRFTDAGHILGSAIVELAIEHANRTYRIVFTGDLGRRGLPFLRQPSPVPAADLLICESTYGGRVHDTMEQMAAKLSEVVRRTLARNGKILIPAFSLGRTQLVVYYLQRWMRDGILPRLPIYVDSPLATHIAEVYRQHADHFPIPQLPDDPPVHYVASSEEGMAYSTQPDPCVVVASGGMCEGGRIIQHLRYHIDDPRSTVVLVSYQAPGSLGARLMERRPTVRFMGRNWNKWVEVVQVNGFSGHADQNDFAALLGPLAGATRQVRLVHGEPPQAASLAASLRLQGFLDVGVPEREEMVAVA